MKNNKPITKDHFNLGDRIHCRDWKHLMSVACYLSGEGYGCTVIGFGDMSADILTITALPEVVDALVKDYGEEIE